ncbi:hypothetical protein K7432_016473 [Basidiobolus ranarum]|uniref:LysM domain-containing protein n=1 Tax=Basidiobolus ranarum TaxID=34480 RepID=A0ABR2WEP1_9FUNG
MEEQTYEIQQGDTLSQIAQNHGVTVADLAERNGIANVDDIQAGEQLFIPNN